MWMVLFLSDRQRPNPSVPAKRDQHQRTFWGRALIAKSSWESKMIFDYWVTCITEVKSSFAMFLSINSDELTRLWNLNPDNMEACKSDSRFVFGNINLKMRNARDVALNRVCVKGSSCHHWRTFLWKLSNKQIHQTWWRKNTSTEIYKFSLINDQAMHHDKQVLCHRPSELCVTQTTAGEPCDCSPEGALTSSSPPTSSSRVWPTIWKTWSSNWPKSFLWVDIHTIRPCR